MTEKKDDALDLSDYHLKFEAFKAGYDRYEKQQRDKITDFLLLMDRTYFFLSDGVEPHLNEPINTELRDVFQLFLARSFKTYRSIHALLEKGCDQDALALLRNLLETVITAKYIAGAESKERAQRFRDFQVVEQHKNIEKNIKVDQNWTPFQPGGAAEIKRVKEGFLEFKRKYGNPKKITSWSGLGIQCMSCQPNVDMLDDYIKAYSSFCLLTHPSFLSGKEYAVDPFKNPSPSWPPTVRKGPVVACLATGYMIKLIETFMAVHGIKSIRLRNIILEIQCNLLPRMNRANVGDQTPLFHVEEGQWGIVPTKFRITEKSNAGHPPSE